ncbi:hypothetical protein L917_14754 [Phytophthora nicotianae]|uniref:Uncharacterized protein n=1 Tax=Phytophthora nicotianae TaxID=4792 RepID=W2KMA9_PHYNI|nr:hypothetical protein L917_14754 [Phytophthora nicotianae]ETM38907.1 hypothetical protein L914_14890 [Phytophthora nicotianae]
MASVVAVMFYWYYNTGRARETNEKSGYDEVYEGEELDRHMGYRDGRGGEEDGPNVVHEEVGG